MNFIKALMGYLKRTPAPGFVIAIVLSIRWQCRVSFGARIYYPCNLRIGKGARIGRCRIIATGKGVTIGNSVGIDEGALLDAHRGNILIRDCTAIGPYVVIYGEGGVDIGEYSMLAAHSIVVASQHVHVSTKIPIKLQGTIAKGITIANDVWIGANAVVQDGVSIGKGSIVGSNAVVRENVPEYAVAAGVPARIVKNRNSDD